MKNQNQRPVMRQIAAIVRRHTSPEVFDRIMADVWAYREELAANLRLSDDEGFGHSGDGQSMSGDLQRFLETLAKNEGIPFDTEADDDVDEGEETVRLHIGGEPSWQDVFMPAAQWDAIVRLADSRGMTVEELCEDVLRRKLIQAEML